MKNSLHMYKNDMNNILIHISHSMHVNYGYSKHNENDAKVPKILSFGFVVLYLI